LQFTSIAESYKNQLLNEVIPFWEDRVTDTEQGGYFNYFTRDGTRFSDDKPGWFVGRTMHTFAALHSEFGHLDTGNKWLNIAKAGREFFNTSFYAGNGRFNKMLTRDGCVLEGTTSIFTDCFAVKGLYEYIHATGYNPSDIELALQLSQKLFANLKDPEIVQQGSHLQTHAATFMSLVVAQESRKIFGNKYQPVIDECINRSLFQFANDTHQAPLEYLAPDGSPVLTGRGRLIDPGHTMEALWFAMEEGVHTERAGQVLDWVIDRCYDEEYGGFYHICDIDGGKPKDNLDTVDYGIAKINWNDKVWWVQCEALVALAMSARLNNNPRHYKYFLKQMEFTESLFRDKEYGEWYAFVKPDGTILSDIKGFAGKGPYHVPRCLMKLATLR